MTKRQQIIEVIQGLDECMEQIQTNPDIWQHKAIYCICKGLKLLLEEKLKKGA